MQTKLQRTHNNFPFLKDYLEYMFLNTDIENVVLDGEVVSLDEKKQINFMDLVRRKGVLKVYVFDILYLNDQDLRGEPYLKRKEQLKILLQAIRQFFKKSPLLYQDHVTDNEEKLRAFIETLRKVEEGVVFKKTASPYGDLEIFYRGSTKAWRKFRYPGYPGDKERARIFRKEPKSGLKRPA